MIKEDFGESIPPVQKVQGLVSGYLFIQVSADSLGKRRITPDINQVTPYVLKSSALTTVIANVTGTILVVREQSCVSF